MSNVPVIGNYPAVEFQPGETSSVYHTDQEFTDSSGNSHMYRTYNAQYDSIHGTWNTLTAGVSHAYATVQDPAGSIHYYWNNGVTSNFTWVGSGNNTVFNPVDYGMVANSTAAAGPNVTALFDALNAAGDAGGGTVFIPAGTYYLNSAITLGSHFPNVGIVIVGASGGTELVQTANADIFTIHGLRPNAGIRFQDITFSYYAPTITTIYAVNTSSCQNVTCHRVFFSDCPGSANFGASSTKCGLFDCTITYDIDLDNAIMVTLAGDEDYVVNCTIFQRPLGHSPPGPSGCTGIFVGSGGGGRFVTNTQISGFDTGIWIQGGGVNLLKGFFSNVHCESNVNAVYIVPGSSSGKIYQVFFSNCDFFRDQMSTSGTAGVYIDTNGGPNTNVSDIFFNNCMCHDWAGPGLQINSGQNIVITGGRYGSNATGSGMSTSGGIAVTGDASRVSIIGADCSGQIPSYHSQPPGGSLQPHGISVTGVVSNMQVRGCNLNGNGTGPLYAPIARTDLQVTDCPGYNDQTVPLAIAVPTSGAAFNGTTYGYYGPVIFYVSGGTVSQIVAYGHVTGLTSGSFRITPHSLIVGFVDASITYNVALPHPTFLMIGQ